MRARPTSALIRAPKPEDEISIFFYRGTEGEDSASVEVKETVKKAVDSVPNF